MKLVGVLASPSFLGAPNPVVATHTHPLRVVSPVHVGTVHHLARVSVDVLRNSAEAIHVGRLA